MEKNSNYDDSLLYDVQEEDQTQYDDAAISEQGYIEEQYIIDQYNFYPDGGF